MGRIVISDPDFVDDYIRPHPNGVHGVYRLSYLGTGVPLSAVREQNVERPTAHRTGQCFGIMS